MAKRFRKMPLVLAAWVLAFGLVLAGCDSPTGGSGGNAGPALTGTVSITGAAQVGQTLTANTASLGGSGDISFQWRRGTTNIGTNSGTYTVQTADVGQAITVTVTRAGHSGSVISASTAIIAATPPPLAGTVSITGTAQVGQTLTANTSNLGGSGSISFQWMRGNINIGTDSVTYTVQAEDAGFTITVIVTRAGYSGSVTSTPTAFIIIPPLTGTVSITGTAQGGQTLTANTANLGGSGSISFQWMRGGINIGTDSATYTVQAEDVGSTITVTVTRVGYSGSVISDPTNTVIEGPPAVPTNVSASVAFAFISPIGITVSWNPIPNAIGYHVYRGLSATGVFHRLETVTSTSFTDTEASRNVRHYYRVSAFNDIGVSARSVHVSQIMNTRPDTPTNVTATRSQFGTTSLSWGAVPGATSYRIYRSLGSPNNTLSFVATVTGRTNFTSSSVFNPMPFYRVVAVNDHGQSSPSEAVQLR